MKKDSQSTEYNKQSLKRLLNSLGGGKFTWTSQDIQIEKPTKSKK